MAPSVRVRFGKKAKAGPCDNCLSEIPKDTLHAAVTQSFGQSKGGKGKYKGSHVHAVCLSAFLIQDYIQYMGRERKPEGRQVGSSPFNLPEGQQKERKHLVRTRARLLRLVLAIDPEDQERYMLRRDHLRKRILEIQERLTECGGPPRQSMMRRDATQRAQLEFRLNV